MTDANFERCADFLARMIEKYGGELDLPKLEVHSETISPKAVSVSQEKCS